MYTELQSFLTLSIEVIVISSLFGFFTALGRDLYAFSKRRAVEPVVIEAEPVEPIDAEIESEPVIEVDKPIVPNPWELELDAEIVSNREQSRATASNVIPFPLALPAGPELAKLTKKQLTAIARQKGIKVTAKMRKAQIIEAIAA